MRYRFKPSYDAKNDTFRVRYVSRVTARIGSGSVAPAARWFVWGGLDVSVQDISPGLTPYLFIPQVPDRALCRNGVSVPPSLV